MMHRQANIK